MGVKTKNEALERLSIEEFRVAPKRKVVIVLDNVRSLHNVGSAFRTADAFLLEEIILCGLTGTPPDRDIEKTALGATESVPWRKFQNTLEAVAALQKNGYKVFAIEQAQNSLPLNKFEYAEEPTAFVFGHEVYGVEQEVIDVCDGTLEIPQAGTKHSLNISVAVGIVLWEVLRKTFDS
jgi:23S rRNA (guanosine2251-2'-O)-methyltransferase